MRHDEVSEMIRDAGWWNGTMQEWNDLEDTTRRKIAFNATGCAVAWCTWTVPVDCVHTGCQILRGELPKIAETNRTLRAEAESGWLRFISDRRKLAAIFKAYRRAARESGIYDPWKLDPQSMVYAGVMS